MKIICGVEIVTGTAAGEIFEFDSTLTNSTFTNVVINAAGDKDTIKVSSSNVQATILNLDLPGSSYYFSTQADGINIVNSSGSLDLKFLGTTDTSIFANANANFQSLDQQTTANGQAAVGTGMNDNIVINHSDYRAFGYGGDDVLIFGNFNLLEGGDGTLQSEQLRHGQRHDNRRRDHFFGKRANQPHHEKLRLERRQKQFNHIRHRLTAFPFRAIGLTFRRASSAITTATTRFSTRLTTTLSICTT